jgi:hypothetical protein
LSHSSRNIRSTTIPDISGINCRPFGPDKFFLCLVFPDLTVGAIEWRPYGPDKFFLCIVFPDLTVGAIEGRPFGPNEFFMRCVHALTGVATN